MKKNLKYIFSFLFAGVAMWILVVTDSYQQGTDLNHPLPVKYWNSNQNQPLIFYISGDAGFNSFSKNLSDSMFRNGFDVYALNTKKYFWKQKTPQQCADDFSSFLESLFSKRTNQKLVIVGYSFGADALPFVMEKFPQKTRKRIEKIILIDPSETGDLEISLESYINEKASGRWKTIPVINKVTDIPVEFILSDFSAAYYPYSQVALKNKKLYRLPGNHRFNGNVKLLADTIARSLHQQ